jgi:hypothetical protein
MNAGIDVLSRAIQRLDELGVCASLQTYKPEWVEMRINACCKRHPHCRDEVRCVRLWDMWSEIAPVRYSPMSFERFMEGTPSLYWLPVLILGIKRDSWELPQSRLTEEI